MTIERKPWTAGGLIALLAAVWIPPAQAQQDSPASEYRLTLSPHHEIAGDLTGSGEFGYYWNPDDDYETFTGLWPGLNYRATRWLQLFTGLRTLYTDNEFSADTLELRPYAGVKLFLPTDSPWHFYNQTGYEVRHTLDLTADDWTRHDRIRSRFGVEIPLTARDRAWQPKTWYVLADVEPFYRFDRNLVDQVRTRAGIGCIVGDKLHLELIYAARFTQSTGGHWDHTENSLRLNVRIGLHDGLLQRLRNPRHDD